MLEAKSYDDAEQSEDEFENILKENKSKVLTDSEESSDSMDAT